MKTNPDRFTLEKFAWQLFGHLTFRDEPRKCDLNPKRFRAALRYVERALRLTRGSLHYFLALEHSESDRAHFHCLIMGIPSDKLARWRWLRDIVKWAWKKKGGGLAKVQRYTPGLGGIAYAAKDTRASANVDCGSPWYSEGILKAAPHE